MSIDNQTSMSGEAASVANFSDISERDMSVLYVAMRHISNDGKEALEDYQTDVSEEKVTVKLKRWNIIYRQEGEQLKYDDLQYLIRARR